MPGAQPRRDLMTRLASTVTRRAFVPAGVPGVWGVTRVAAHLAPSETPWIQGPDFEMTFSLEEGLDWFTQTVIYVVGTVSDYELVSDVGEGVDLSAPPLLTVQPTLTTAVGILQPALSTDIYASAHRAHLGVAGEDLVELADAIAAGAYTPPTGTFEYEHPAGTLVGDVVLEGNRSTTTGAPSFEIAVTGSLWANPAGYNPFRPVSDVVAEDFQVMTWGPTVPQAFTVTHPAATLFGPDLEAGTMWLTILNSGLIVPGTVTRPEGVQGVVAEATITDLTLTVTVRPPRHRFLPDPPVSDWVDGSGGWGPDTWLWDAGEYLPSDFDTLDGHPATLPAGATQLTFYVVPPGSVFVDGSYDDPSAFGSRDTGSYGFAMSPDPSTPDAGSHLWVVWVGTDPTGIDPASLVPAALAENGTG